MLRKSAARRGISPRVALEGGRPQAHTTRRRRHVTGRASLDLVPSTSAPRARTSEMRRGREAADGAAGAARRRAAGNGPHLSSSNRLAWAVTTIAVMCAAAGVPGAQGASMQFPSSFFRRRRRAAVRRLRRHHNRVERPMGPNQNASCPPSCALVLSWRMGFASTETA